MTRTAQFSLPLLMPAQAQKHVTVNEALARLDAVAQLRIVSSSEPMPPSGAAEGESFLVPAGAGGEWGAKVGQIATRSNAGWVYVTPKAGWRAWEESSAGPLIFDGVAWLADAVAVTPGGAALVWRAYEFDHPISAGASSQTGPVIPAGALVVGITGRVVDEITGTGITGWRIGVPNGLDRYGTGLGVQKNSYVVGLSGSPVAYYVATPLHLQAEGGQFIGGRVRLCVCYCQLLPPRAV